MLRQAIALMGALICFGGLCGFCPISHAAGCSAMVNTNGLFNSDIAAGLSCVSSSGGSHTSEVSSQYQSGVDHSWDYDYGDAAAADSCYNMAGERVDCWYKDYWWSPANDMWCKAADDRFRASNQDDHIDAAGNYYGTMYRCANPGREGVVVLDAARWEPAPAPLRATVDAETVVKEKVATLELRQPTVGVGAYTYPGHEDWGPSWWVGAPMWLWVDQSDPRQWGTHTLSASLDGVTMTATVDANRVSFDPGDGSEPVVCANPGTYRPWDKNDLLRNHSPSGCEHTYMKTNTLGDRDSRYLVTAAVTWRVTWSATNGQSGAFTTEVASAEPASIHVGEIYTVNGPPPKR